MQTYLDFEKPVADLQGKIQELKNLAATDQAVSIDEEVSRLQARADEALTDIYKKLTPWQKIQVARHPQRPHFSDYTKALITEFVPLAGDRKFAEDAAIQAGFGRFHGTPVAVIGQEQGSTTESRLKHNFGMARPEGYRKAVRVMEMADKFDLPILCFVDTKGAYPGIGAEERGQAEAIARSTDKCLQVGVPNLAIVIGEGGSGGALAIAVANKVLMLEHAVYAASSPEAGASILFRDPAKAPELAAAQKITAADLLSFGVIDGIIAEPVGGAHRHHETVMKATETEIETFLSEFADFSRQQLREHRRDKYLKMTTTITPV